MNNYLDNYVYEQFSVIKPKRMTSQKKFCIFNLMLYAAKMIVHNIISVDENA